MPGIGGLKPSVGTAKAPRNKDANAVYLWDQRTGLRTWLRSPGDRAEVTDGSIWGRTQSTKGINSTEDFGTDTSFSEAGSLSEAERSQI